MCLSRVSLRRDFTSLKMTDNLQNMVRVADRANHLLGKAQKWLRELQKWRRTQITLNPLNFWTSARTPSCLFFSRHRRRSKNDSSSYVISSVVSPKIRFPMNLYLQYIRGKLSWSFQIWCAVVSNLGKPWTFYNIVYIQKFSNSSA